MSRRPLEHLSDLSVPSLRSDQSPGGAGGSQTHEVAQVPPEAGLERPLLLAADPLAGPPLTAHQGALQGKS